MKTGNTPNFSHGLGDGDIKKAIGQVNKSEVEEVSKPEGSEEETDKETTDKANTDKGKTAAGQDAQNHSTQTQTKYGQNAQNSKDIDNALKPKSNNVGETLRKIDRPWNQNGAQTAPPDAAPKTIADQDPVRAHRERIAEALKSPVTETSGSDGGSRIRDELKNKSELQSKLSNDELIGGHKPPDQLGFTGNDNQLATAGALGYGANNPPNGGQAALAQAGVTVINPPATNGTDTGSYSQPLTDQNPVEVETKKEPEIDMTDAFLGPDGTET